MKEEKGKCHWSHTLDQPNFEIQGKTVRDAVIADNTGYITILFWEDAINNLKENATVLRGFKCLH